MIHLISNEYLHVFIWQEIYEEKSFWISFHINKILRLDAFLISLARLHAFLFLGFAQIEFRLLNLFTKFTLLYEIELDDTY
jgi:hypothetical protein